MAQAEIRIAKRGRIARSTPLSLTGYSIFVYMIGKGWIQVKRGIMVLPLGSIHCHVLIVAFQNGGAVFIESEESGDKSCILLSR